jgi:TetR/AcrR family transcriptional repressor of mexJK operon
VSKVTIYSYFPTKAALFQAAITHRIDSQFGPLGPGQLDPGDPRAALTQIGRGILALMRSLDVINQHRSLYGALGQDTSAAESFFAAGPQKLVDAVAGYLRAAHRAGSLRVTDPALAVNQYLSLFLGLGQVRTLLGLAPPSKREDEALLKANVALMLRALAP